ncbi:hypothetical protein QAD02_002010 [Eretmocerus hayati]|uniref:Uncharacterized protein n=1 Tax=Eretmocerus hayati TaxID=131215 RepID=A0ACC2NJE8_9HYME|nr:hypothetical protein QAD02_002010 [Eretmocerus hayati]
MYVKEEDEQQISENLQIHYDNTNYWVCFTTDSTNCYKCQQSGHVARFCPNAVEFNGLNFPALISDASSQHPVPNISITSEHTAPVNQPNVTTQKRPLESLSEESTAGTSNIDVYLQDMPPLIAPLEPERSTDTDREQVGRPAAKNMTDDSHGLASSAHPNAIGENFHNFLEKSKGVPRNELAPLLSEHFLDEDSVIEMIDEAYETASDRKLKGRLIRLKEKLSNSNSVCTSGSDGGSLKTTADDLDTWTSA